ncbi:MAG: hypothetical protein FWE01_01540, partial [Firmicutes bacterium]|nr:hypothetical protein [Bacillota bacterium]
MTCILIAAVLLVTSNNSDAVDANIGNAPPWQLEARQVSGTRMITTNGQLWSWGLHNGMLQVGDGAGVSRSSPVRIGVASNWVSVCGNGMMTHAINSDGQLWRFGYAADANILTPQRFGTASNWASVSCEDVFCAGITTNHQLWVWGGPIPHISAIGNGTTSLTILQPIQIGHGQSWASVSVGLWTRVAVTTNGQLFVWGVNWDGISDNFSGHWQRHLVPTRIGTASNWASAVVARVTSTSQNHILALTTDGQLFSWGFEAVGALGHGVFGQVIRIPRRIGTASNWVSVNIGHGASFAVNSLGQLFAWGNNVHGQLGLGDTSSRNVPTRVGTASNWVEVSSEASSQVNFVRNSLNQVFVMGQGGVSQGMSDNVTRNVPTMMTAMTMPVSISALPGGRVNQSSIVGSPWSVGHEISAVAEEGFHFVRWESYG